MDLRGQIKDVSVNYIGRVIRLNFSIDYDEQVIQKLHDLMDVRLHLILKRFKKPRTLNMNAYFWKLCTELARALDTTSEEIHQKMVIEQGVVWLDDEGRPMPVAVRNADKFKNMPGYWKAYRSFPGYVLALRIKGTSEYDVNEMSRCLDDLIEEARAQGIQTATPDELARIKALGVG